MAQEQCEQRYVEGRASVRAALLGLLVGGIGLFFVLHQQIDQIILEISWIAESQPQVAIRMGNRLLLWLVLLSGAVSAAIGVYLVLLALRITRETCFPPRGMPLAFRVPVLRGARALQQGRRYRGVGLLLCVQPLAGLLFWYWISGGAV